MSVDPDEDLAVAVAIHLAGMLVPVVVATAFADLLFLYLSGTAFAVLAAVAFGLVAWLLVEERDLDRPNTLVAAVVGPLVAFLGFVGYALVAGTRAPGARYLFVEVGPFRYVGLFVAAGVGAVALSWRYRTLAARDDRVPSPRRALAGLGVAVGLVAVLVAGINLAAANSTAVATVEPGVASPGDPSLNVSLDGPPAEVRVTAVAPDGTSVTKRLSRAETRGETATASIRVWFDDTPPPGRLPVQSGTYRVRVTALSGVTVDRATFEAETGTAVSIEAVEATDGNLSWARRSRVPDAGPDATAVGVVVENRGAFLTPTEVRLVVGGDERPARTLFLAPGERGRVAFQLSPEVVAAARANGNGTASVRLYPAGAGDDPAATATVDLPAE